MKQTQSGFTLIEIAIVLVIIGLLLGGVVKGQELVNGAKVRNLAADFRNIPILIYSYQDKFRAIPGDDGAVTSHLTGSTAATTPSNTNGNGILDGAWNSTTSTDESYLFWQHVRLANLTTGTTTTSSSDYLPKNASGGTIGLQSGSTANAPITGMRGTYVICSSSIPGRFAKQLDTQLDDGNTAAGMMLATPTANYAIGNAATATASIDDNTSYTVCMGV